MLQLKLFFQDKIKGKKVTEKTKFPKKSKMSPFGLLYLQKKFRNLNKINSRKLTNKKNVTTFMKVKSLYLKKIFFKKFSNPSSPTKQSLSGKNQSGQIR